MQWLCYTTWVQYVNFKIQVLSESFQNHAQLKKTTKSSLWNTFQQLSFQAILMDTNCSMKTRSYSTQGAYYQGEDMDPEYDDYD